MFSLPILTLVMTLPAIGMLTLSMIVGLFEKSTKEKLSC